jgi:hypothetical protein
MDMIIEVILFLLTGLVAGAFGGLLGLGGATILVPALTLAFGLPIHLAIAVSLVSNIFVSATAAIGYGRKGLIDKRIVLIMNAGSIAGIVIGTVIATRSPAALIKVLFGAFLLILVAEALLRKRQKEEEARGEPEKINVPGFSALGFGMGLLGALLGLGGGTLAVPVQNSLFGVPLRNAIANSLATIFVSATLGAVLYFLLGSGHLFSAEEALLTTAAVVPGSVIGANLAASVSEKVPTRYIRFIFYAVLLYIAGNMIKSGMGW